MKKINWKQFNFAMWIEIVLSYLLPFQVKDNFQYQVGFPAPYLSVYDTEIGISPLMSMHLNPLGFLFDVLIIYLVLSAGAKIGQKYR